MTFAFDVGHFAVRFATTPADALACQELRHSCFFATAGRDDDEFDAASKHLMVFSGKRLVGTARLNVVANRQDLLRTYTASRYDLEDLEVHLPALEIGRFCIDPDHGGSDVIRLVWGAVTKLVDDTGARFLFGCASFPGHQPDKHARALSLLSSRHRPPAGIVIGRKSLHTVPLGPITAKVTGAMDQVPTLLRSYLNLGGWVSDHAVIDAELDSLHVFCGLEVARIPPRRAERLRALLR